MDANLAALSSLDQDELLDAVVVQVLAYAKSNSFETIPSKVIQECLSAWIDGKGYDRILPPLTAARVKFGNAWATVDHVVKLCESGFGYDLSMVAAVLADLVEESSPELNEKLTKVHKRIKYGLCSAGAIAFYEAGYADRVVAQTLCETFPSVVHKSDVRKLCRSEPDQLLAALEPFPSYFTYVATEAGGG
jgi:hypothetical protein